MGEDEIEENDFEGGESEISQSDVEISSSEEELLVYTDKLKQKSKKIESKALESEEEKDYVKHDVSKLQVINPEVIPSRRAEKDEI